MPASRKYTENQGDHFIVEQDKVLKLSAPEQLVPCAGFGSVDGTAWQKGL